MLQSDVQVSAVRLCGKVPWLGGKNREFPVSCSSYTILPTDGGPLTHKNAAASTPRNRSTSFYHRQPSNAARLRPSVIPTIQPTRKSLIHLRRAACAIQDRHVNVTICDLFRQILRPQ
jgi:hypothetical protein